MIQSPTPPGLAQPSRASRIERWVALLTVFGPLVGLVIAVMLFWGRGVSWLHLGIGLAFYSVTLLGITLGFHRLFTHRSFAAVGWVRGALAIAGSMACQGPVLYWVACHRKHHRHSDHAGDPHSPHLAGTGALGWLRGGWHAHVGWMLNHEPDNYFRLAPDLLRDRALMRINRLYFVWVFAGILLPGLIAAAATRSWSGLWTGMVWGGLVRIFVVHHATWSVNSLCHLFGRSPFRTDDESRNNAVCALLTFGEGWHNNHHAFPTSARHGLRWWQIDATYLVIRLLSGMRLAWDIRLPDHAQLAAKAA
ncbi:MAG: acyl-CoA desaturase [Verrucomicrobiota bacterium]